MILFVFLFVTLVLLCFLYFFFLLKTNTSCVNPQDLILPGFVLFCLFALFLKEIESTFNLIRDKVFLPPINPLDIF